MLNLQGCSLGLDVSVSRRFRDVFPMSRSRRNVVMSRSRSRLELKIERLGLVAEGLVYKVKYSVLFCAHTILLVGQICAFSVGNQ